MAILSDQELWNLIGAGRLKIDPPPAFDAISPSTIDLSLANDFTRLKMQGKAIKTRLDTRNSSEVMAALKELGEPETIEGDACFVLYPNEFVLAWTREWITLPNFLSARVEGRSTLARLGLSIHQTAPTVHPTFSNRLQLELYNGGPYELELYPGEKICQLIVETMSLPSTTSLQSIHQGVQRPQQS